MRAAMSFVLSRGYVAGLMAVMLMVALPPQALAAGLSLELNKTLDSAQGCVATVLIGNQSGKTLDRFRIDLVLFNDKGVIFDRLLIDLAPLPAQRTTIANFPLHDGACQGVTRILLHDVPACRTQPSSTFDCLNGLTVSSRMAIGFDK